MSSRRRAVSSSTSNCPPSLSESLSWPRPLNTSIDIWLGLNLFGLPLFPEEIADSENVGLCMKPGDLLMFSVLSLPSWLLASNSNESLSKFEFWPDFVLYNGFSIDICFLKFSSISFILLSWTSLSCSSSYLSFYSCFSIIFRQAFSLFYDLSGVWGIELTLESTSWSPWSPCSPYSP